MSLIKKLNNIIGDSDAIKYKDDIKQSLLNNLDVLKENESIHLKNFWSENRMTFCKRCGCTSCQCNSGGCYIATMAYGDYDHPQVLELRRFRDEILEKSLLGRFFISIYYSFSPRLVMYLQYKHKINIMIKKILDNFINYYLK